MQPFIPAGELKQNYGVFGHFYSVEITSKEVVECRSVLEIAIKAHTPKDHSELSAHSPDALLLEIRQYGNWPKSVPVCCAVRDAYGRKCNMTDNSSVNFCNKRDHQYVGGTQRLYYVVLSLLADRVILECRYRDLSNSIYVSRFFLPNDHFHFQYRVPNNVMIAFSLNTKRSRSFVLSSPICVTPPSQ